MDEHAAEVMPGEMLAWAREDARRKTPRLWVRASKAYRVDPDEHGDVARIGEDEEARPVMVRGVLELSPQRGRGGWTLQLAAEESVGLRAAGEDEGYTDEDDMTVDAFEADFLAPERGEITVVVRADDMPAWRRFQRWLAARRKVRA